MSGDDLLENMKSPIWLGCTPIYIPVAFLKDPPDSAVRKTPIKFDRYLQDKFELDLQKVREDRITATLLRKRQNPYEAPDDGYMLRFYLTMIGFDEDTKVVLMRHDQEYARASIRLTKKTKFNLARPTAYIDLFVMAQMLEIKSLDASDQRKVLVDETLSFMKSRLTADEVETLEVILNRPGLDYYFTGRMPPSDFKTVWIIATHLMTYYTKIDEYNKAKAENEDIEMPDFDMGKQLHYIAFGNRENEISPLNAVRQLMVAHSLGMTFFRNVVFGYLMTIIDKDFIVLDILEVAVVFRDEELFEIAIPYFLLRFYEILDSESFASLSNEKGYVSRLIMHEARRWIQKKSFYIPGWRKRT